MSDQYIIADIIEKHIGDDRTEQVLLAADEIDAYYMDAIKRSMDALFGPKI